MRDRTLVRITLLLLFLSGGIALAGTGKHSKKAQSTNTASSAGPKNLPVHTKPVRKPIDPDEAYKANCARCHVEPRKFSERETATVMLHMRVRSNLTEEETKAILKYLTQ